MIANQQLVEHYAQGVDIGLWADRQRLDLLGGDVGRCAQDGAGLGGLRLSAQLLGDAEVGEVGVALLIEQDVGWFEVAVDNALLVGGFQGGGDLVDQSGSVVRLPGARAVERSCQRSPFHQAHDQVGALGIAPEVVERHDVQVLELGDQLRFALEAADEVGLVSVLGQDHLDGDLPFDERLAGAVHSAVSPLTERFEQIIAFDRAGT